MSFRSEKISWISSLGFHVNGCFYLMEELCLLFRIEHPAGGYKKIFETCEELNEPIPAVVVGM